jgi:hypothetical protein
MRRALKLLSLTAALLLPSYTLAETKPAWTLRLDSPLRWTQGAADGMRLVGTRREILGVRRDDGTVRWRLGPVEDSNMDDVEPLPPFPYALVSLGKRKAPGLPSVFLVDVRDGHTVWTADSLGVGWSIGSYLIPGTHRLLLRSALKPKGKAQTAMLLDVEKGHRLWARPELGENSAPDTVFSEQARVRQQPLFETDSTIILQTDSRTLRKYDLRTGSALWVGDGLPRPDEPNPIAKQGARLIKGLKGLLDLSKETGDESVIFDVTFAPMLLARSGDRFYAPYRNSVVPVSRETGRPLWDLPPPLSGIVIQMLEIPAGLLVRTLSYEQGSPGYAIYLLQRESGLRLWRVPGKSVDTWSSTSNFLVEGDRILIATDGKLLVVDIPTGQDHVLGKLDFEGDDKPRFLNRMNEGLCVAGAKNLGIYSPDDGRRIRKFYREAPGGSSGLGLALLGVSAISYGTGILEGVITPDVGLNELTKEYTSTNERDAFAFFLGNVQVGGKTQPGLVRVNMRTGNPEGEVVFGTKKPDYAVDADGWVIFIPDSKSLVGYRF